MAENIKYKKEYNYLLWLKMKTMQNNKHHNTVKTQATLRENKSNIYKYVIPGIINTWIILKILKKSVR